MYSPVALVKWLKDNITVFSIQPPEVRLACPFCGYENFYFNIEKGIGYCHKASCNQKPSVDRLILLWGNTPESSSWEPLQKIETFTHKESTQDEKVLMPKTAHPIVQMDRGRFYTLLPEELNQVKGRGLSVKQIYDWGLHADNTFIYIPVYFKGELVQYVGRKKWWIPHKRPKYQYAKGKPISNFLFGWDQQNWDWLTLVENTFVSLWLRDEINCTTNFGSSLSQVQADLIANSPIKKVVILWDENTEKRAKKAKELLRSKGVSCSIVQILNQPDSYKKEYIVQIVKQAKNSHTGEYFDYRSRNYAKSIS